MQMWKQREDKAVQAGDGSSWPESEDEVQPVRDPRRLLPPSTFQTHAGLEAKHVTTDKQWTEKVSKGPAGVSYDLNASSDGDSDDEPCCLRLFTNRTDNDALRHMPRTQYASKREPRAATWTQPACPPPADGNCNTVVPV
jgi:hypothetical protein